MSALEKFNSQRTNTAAPAQGRGRFAGVKAADNRYPLLPVGEYELKVIETYVTQNPKSGEWYHADFEILSSNVQGFGQGQKGSWLQGISGKSQSVGLPKVKRFCMAAAGTEDEGAYDAQDPQGDLIDASCGLAVEGLEKNPLGGTVILCSVTPGKPRQDGRSLPEYALTPGAQ
jgi:hypothetical protein